MQAFTKLLANRIISMALLLLTIIVFVGCETTVIEVNEIEFFITKNWKIESVIVNGDVITDTDLTQYRLELKDDFTFNRTTIEGVEDVGEWKLTAGLSQLVLFVGDPREERYLLLDLKVRKMEIKLLQDSFKQGELDIRYFLEPVKGQ
jgi:hypothetical protein